MRVLGNPTILPPMLGIPPAYTEQHTQTCKHLPASCRPLQKQRCQRLRFFRISRPGRVDMERVPFYIYRRQQEACLVSCWRGSDLSSAV